MLRLGTLLRNSLASEAIAAAAVLQPGSGSLAQRAQFGSAAEQAEDIEQDTLVAQPREDTGRRAAARLRKEGRTPGILFSFPGEEEKLVSFDSKSIKQQLARLGRTGWACQLFQVQLQGSGGEPAQTVPALGRQVHITADTDVIENVTLMYCPPERLVRVDIPVKVFGEEVCPGIKAGGRINWIKRTISCIAPGGRIPTSFEIDISRMALNEKVLLSELPVPEGVLLRDKDHSLPVIKLSK